MQQNLYKAWQRLTISYNKQITTRDIRWANTNAVFALACMTGWYKDNVDNLFWDTQIYYNIYERKGSIYAVEDIVM